MRITRETEKRLITQLRKKNISIPELQSKLCISYKDARSLIEYSIKRGWIGECNCGNKFPVIVKSFERKKLSQDICENYYEEFENIELKTLFCIAQKFSATLSEITDDVGTDESRIENALDELTAANLVFQVESYYYCTLSRDNINFMKEKMNEAARSSLEFLWTRRNKKG